MQVPTDKFWQNFVSLSFNHFNFSASQQLNIWSSYFCVTFLLPILGSLVFISLVVPTICSHVPHHPTVVACAREFFVSFPFLNFILFRTFHLFMPILPHVWHFPLNSVLVIATLHSFATVFDSPCNIHVPYQIFIPLTSASTWACINSYLYIWHTPAKVHHNYIVVKYLSHILVLNLQHLNLVTHHLGIFSFLGLNLIKLLYYLGPWQLVIRVVFMLQVIKQLTCPSSWLASFSLNVKYHIQHGHTAQTLSHVCHWHHIFTFINLIAFPILVLAFNFILFNFILVVTDWSQTL